MHQPQLLSRPLKAFIKLAEALSYGEAAEALGITQPALTQQIVRLEQELGDIRLFDRGRAGVRLTEAGKEFLAYAHRAKQELEFGAEAVDAIRGLQRGTLRVGYSQGQLALVSAVLEDLMKEIPGLTVSVTETMAVRVGELILEGRLDVGLAYNWQASEKLVVTPLDPVELVLVVHEDDPLARRGQVKDLKEELAEEKFILLQGGLAVRRTIDAYMTEQGFAPRVMLETNEAEMIFSFVRKKRGITLFPVTPARDLTSLSTISLPSPPTQRMALLSREGVSHPTVQRFVEITKARTTQGKFAKQQLAAKRGAAPRKRPRG